MEDDGCSLSRNKHKGHAYPMSADSTSTTEEMSADDPDQQGHDEAIFRQCAQEWISLYAQNLFNLEVRKFLVKKR